MSARLDLFKEVIVMAFDTVRTNKMRSGLTVLGIVIGITAIVGMTSLIMGFDRSMRDLFATIGPNTIFIQRFGITDFANGAEIRELLKRPNLTVSDARVLEQQATTLQYVDIELGASVGPTPQECGCPCVWPVSAAVRGNRHGPHRQDGAHRVATIRSRRGIRQAPNAG